LADKYTAEIVIRVSSFTAYVDKEAKIADDSITQLFSIRTFFSVSSFLISLSRFQL
jgi:hypothetical protein